MRGFPFCAAPSVIIIDAEITILHPTLPAIHAEACKFRVHIRIAGNCGAYALQEFARMLEEQIPRLRRYAHALCRDRTAADDLVQDCLCWALTKGHLFQPGTDLRAWLFTMMHHLHVNTVRRGVRQGAALPVEDVEPLLTEPPAQGGGLTLRDLDRAMGEIGEEQRQVILLVGKRSAGLV